MKYRLGLDVGTNSLGWSVLELDDKDEPCRIENAGSRIFSDGRAAKTKATLAATRRDVRSARRRRDRFKQRQTWLLRELTRIGLFPEDEEQRLQLQGKNPLQLRASALLQKLEAGDVGRAIFHLNQRRGFQSNRKDQSEEAVSGVVVESVQNLLTQMGLVKELGAAAPDEKLSPEEKKQRRVDQALKTRSALDLLASQKHATLGAFLWSRHKKKRTTRARRNVDGNLYENYPTRALIQDEFNKIWESQAAYHPKLMTDDAKELIHRIIFTQRPLKRPERGKCSYLPKEDRTFRAMPSFQRYRIYQEVNNLSWQTATKTEYFKDYPDAVNEIIALLERPANMTGHITFKRMKSVLKKREIALGTYDFNLEGPKRKGLDGNLTSTALQKEHCVGPQWHDWSLEKQDQFVQILTGDDEDIVVRDRLQNEFYLSESAIEGCLQAQLQEGTASLSLKAARLLTEKMRSEPLESARGGGKSGGRKRKYIYQSLYASREYRFGILTALLRRGIPRASYHSGEQRRKG